MAEVDKSETSRRTEKLSSLRRLENITRGTGAVMLAVGTFTLGSTVVSSIRGNTNVLGDTATVIRDAGYNDEQNQDLSFLHADNSNTDNEINLIAVLAGGLLMGSGAYQLSRAGSYAQRANMLEVGYEFNPPSDDSSAEQESPSVA